ncbi:MAG: biopolymer transporter ExbD [Pseudomonadota bacterium]|nr:MAG: biopolymer transporter ExbD [Pseudomonadota bacterium]
MRRRFRRHLKHDQDMNITAFMNLMVILVPFLLVTAVFSRITIHELNLPPQASSSVQQKQDLHLEIVIRSESLELGERSRGLLQRIEKTDKGHNYRRLNEVLRQIKERYPDKTAATVLSESDTSYDTLVQVMDAVRVYEVAQGKTVTRYELFPDVSIGDAPIRTASAGTPAAKRR